MSILDALKGSVKLRISVKPVVNKIIDDVLEPALKKIVADSSNKFDDVIMASVYPSLEKELKDRVGVELDKLVLKVPEGLRAFIELE